MSSPAYSKSLGRQGQKKVKEILLNHFPSLDDDDIYSRPMGSPGEDLMLSPKARKLLPFDIEVKYGKQVNLIRACQQASEESRNKKYIPLSIGCYRLEKPQQWYCCLKLEDLLNIMNSNNYNIKNRIPKSLKKTNNNKLLDLIDDILDEKRKMTTPSDKYNKLVKSMTEKAKFEDTEWEK